MDSYTLHDIFSLASSLAFAGFGLYWLYSIVTKHKRADKADKAEAAELENAVKSEYEKVMDAHKPIFALLADISNHGDGSAAVIPYGLGSHFYVLFYNDKISLLSKKEPVVEFNLSVNLITSYYFTDDMLHFNFSDPAKQPNDNYIDLLITRFAYDTSMENFNKYASKQLDYFEYMSENFPKLPKTTVNL